MRIIPVCLLSGLAACGCASKPAPAGPDEPGGGGGGRVMAPGTSGLPALDWGADADAVLARYPGGAAEDPGIVYHGDVEGHPAVARFTLGDGGLSAVAIDWTDTFPSMGDCEATWKELRGELDGRFGPSQAENMAAYWDLPAASVELSCNPGENEGAALSQTYAQREAE